MNESRIYVDEEGLMRLSDITDGDSGKYTCLVDISLDGRVYTSARSIQLTVKDGMYSTLLSLINN